MTQVSPELLAAALARPLPPLPAAAPVIHWDERDLARALAAVFPKGAPAAARRLIRAVLAHYAPLHPRCLQCDAAITWQHAYRCADCSGVFCEACIGLHLWPSGGAGPPQWEG